MIIEPIAYIHTDFKEKFGIPRQSGRVPEALGRVVFEPKYRNEAAFLGIDGFSHLWLIFDFSKAHRDKWTPTVRPPRLGGNKRVGVFASRSPFRPNNIGLSCVKLESVEKNKSDGIVLVVSGVDLLDNTPIFDIKPYIPYSDCLCEAVGGYADEFADYTLKVEFSEQVIATIPSKIRSVIENCIADDPRPSYKRDGERIYSMRFAEFDVRFYVCDGKAVVVSAEVV